MFEAVDAAISVWGADRVGLHLAPRGDAHDMGDSNPAATFGYVAREAGKRKIAFICARESLDEPRQGPMMKKAFGGVFIANQKLTKETGNELLAKGEADAIAFGQLFIANPDLPLRFAKDAPLNTPDPETFYAKAPRAIPIIRFGRDRSINLDRCAEDEELGHDQRLKRIAPVKFGLVLGIVYGLISLVFMPFFMLSSIVAPLPRPTRSDGAWTHGRHRDCLSVSFFPFLYRFRRLVGMLMAWIYNVAASWVGGMEFEVE